MKSPFASLNWGVHTPELPYVFIITNTTANSNSRLESEEDYLYLNSKSLNFYTSFAGAFQAAFNQSASLMDNRAEIWVEEGNQSLYTSPESIFDIQGFYNEAPRTATVTFPNLNILLPLSLRTQGMTSPINNLIVISKNIWNYLSSLSNGLNTWEDFTRLKTQKLTETQRENLNTASATVIETLPDMNPYKLMEFTLIYEDEYYLSESRVTIHIMPRNLEGRA